MAETNESEQQAKIKDDDSLLKDEIRVFIFANPYGLPASVFVYSTKRLISIS